MGQVDGQGREIGQWTWKHPDGEVKTQGDFDKGKRVGPWVWWRQDGTQESVEVYLDGKLHGLCTDWYRNGQKSLEKIYISGSPRSAVVWLPDGTKCPKTNLKEGSGVMYEYDEDGSPKRYIRFRNGKDMGSNRVSHMKTVP